MKKISYLIIALAFMLSFYNVKASADTDCITGAGSQTCTLSEDITVSDALLVQGQVVLDLHGHTITVTPTASIHKGIITILRGGSLTVKDTVGNGKITAGSNSDVYAAIQVTNQYESANGPYATLVIESGTYEGYYYAVTGNGSRHNTDITINGGTLRSLCVDDGLGIYHPQNGTLTINGGTITGLTGIEMRAGTLRVNGGTIIGTGAPVTAVANGSGSTTTGAGIAIAPHTTQKDIDIKVTDGSIQGYAALYESNPQNIANASNQIVMSIVGGEFEAINGGTAAVYSQDETDFIVRGTFNTALSSDYVSDEAEIKEVDGNYVIGNDNYNAVTDDSNYGIDTAYEATNYVSPIESYDVDISWDDLHWVFVYEGDVTDPIRSAWLTKEYYDTTSANMQGATANDVNGEILDDVDNLAEPKVSIEIQNNSTFAVDVDGSIEQKSNANYTNPAGLKIAKEAPTLSYNTQVTVSALATGASANLFVKPTASRFVNNTGTAANVTGEIVLGFAKSN